MCDLRQDTSVFISEMTAEIRAADTFLFQNPHELQAGDLWSVGPFCILLKFPLDSFCLLLEHTPLVIGTGPGLGVEVGVGPRSGEARPGHPSR